MQKIIAFIFCCITISAFGNSYFVSNTGNDGNNGISQQTAWKSLDRANNFSFKEGDSLVLASGEIFNGYLTFSANNSTLHRFTLTTTDTTPATINSGYATAIYLFNSSDISIHNVKLQGYGIKATSIKTHGIEFVCWNANAYSSNINISGVEATGYAGNGIYFSVQDPVYGFSNVRVENCSLHHNGIAGLNMEGYWDTVNSLIRYSNRDIYVAKTNAFNNSGLAWYTDKWTGSGIIISGVAGGLVEHCTAYQNGADNGCLFAGPIGIWMDDAKNVTIQYCESHHNMGGYAKKDGGGFDIDGGSSGCKIQYCNSYENEGAGYGMFQWETRNPWMNDTIRFNNSTNDGRVASYGSIYAWGAGAAYIVSEAQVYGNYIKLDKPGKAIGFTGENFSNINIYNNQVCLQNDAVFAPVIPNKVNIHDNIFQCGQLTLNTRDTTVTDSVPVVVNSYKTAGIKAFPNPAHAVLHLQLSNIQKGNYNVRLINMMGKVVYTNTVSLNGENVNQDITTGSYANGIYVLQVEGINSKLMQKIMIQ